MAGVIIGAAALAIIPLAEGLDMAGWHGGQPPMPIGCTWLGSGLGSGSGLGLGLGLGLGRGLGLGLGLGLGMPPRRSGRTCATGGTAGCICI